MFTMLQFLFSQKRKVNRYFIKQKKKCLVSVGGSMDLFKQSYNEPCSELKIDKEKKLFIDLF